jgi:hypothetical protein
LKIREESEMPRVKIGGIEIVCYRGRGVFLGGSDRRDMYFIYFNRESHLLPYPVERPSSQSNCGYSGFKKGEDYPPFDKYGIGGKKILMNLSKCPGVTDIAVPFDIRFIEVNVEKPNSQTSRVLLEAVRSAMVS